MLSRIKDWLNADEKHRAHRIYIALIAQARNPFFYTRCAVPDTLDGRFEAILAHLFLALHRLKAEPDGAYLAETRALTEAYFADMDRSLREMGIGDTGVSRRVKAMANACYGRIHAYERALSSTEAMEEALRRNVYATASSVPNDAVSTFARYLLASRIVLGTTPIAEIAEGRIIFAEIQSGDRAAG